MSRTGRLCIVVAALAAAAPAGAFDLAEGNLSISGFGRWAYGDTDGNAFIVGREEGKADNVGVAVNVFARPADRLAVSAQFFQDLSRVNIDWAFAEWRFADALRLRAGQVKLPFGAYMEVKDVGTLRPFYNLPVSVYGFADLAAESYYGGGLTGFLPAPGGVELSYDVYAGSMWVESNDRFRAAPAAPAGPPPANPAAAAPTVFTRVDGVVGGRLTVSGGLPGLTLRASGYRGEVADLGAQAQGAGPAGSAFYAYGVSVEYLSEWLELRGEGFRKSEGRDATLGEIETGYVEAAVRIPAGLQLAGRAERASYDVAGFGGPASLRRHREYAAGLNYWFGRELVVKASCHWIDGNRFAVPEAPWNALTTNGTQGPGDPADLVYDSRTRMLLVGAQFSF